MTQYLLSVWHDGDEYPMPEPDVLEQMHAQVGAFNDELMAGGAFVFGGGLHPKSTAKVVRADGGDVSTTNGPYAESEQQMGGFWIINAPNLDAALALAAKGAAACMGPVEVRQFQDEPA